MATYITGGTSPETPTSLVGAIADPANSEFILGDGFYTGGDINSAVLAGRESITLTGESRWGAKLGPLGLSAPNITIDGIETTYDLTSVITVASPGARILNCRIHDFNRVFYGNGIWVLKSALDPANRVIIQGNTITDWGGPIEDADIGSGILVGASPPETIDIDEITVEISGNQVTNGPTVGHGAGIGIFHPCIISGNYVDSIFGSGISSKARNSIIRSNEVSRIFSDGALYNRFQGNNVWEYNLVHDCDVGVDHFMGEGDTFRGNVIYRAHQFGRIKNQGTTTNLLIERNTFWISSGPGWTWDLGDPSGFEMSDILWRNNIWHTTAGEAIRDEIPEAWNEAGNVFWRTVPPLGTISVVMNPRLADPPLDFRPLGAKGKGAPWPLPGFPALPAQVPLTDDYGVTEMMTDYKRRMLFG